MISQKVVWLQLAAAVGQYCTASVCQIPLLVVLTRNVCGTCTIFFRHHSLFSVSSNQISYRLSVYTVIKEINPHRLRCIYFA